MSPPALFTQKRAAKRWNVSARFLRQLVRAGRLRVVVINKRQYYRDCDWEALCAKGITKCPSISRREAHTFISTSSSAVVDIADLRGLRAAGKPGNSSGKSGRKRPSRAPQEGGRT